MECYPIYQESRAEVLRANKGVKSIEAYKEALFRSSYGDKFGRTFRILDTESGNGNGNRNAETVPGKKDNKNKKGKKDSNNKKDAGSGSLGQISVEVCEGVYIDSTSSGASDTGDRPTIEFRSLLSGKIRTKTVDWKDCDSDPEVQSSLYAFLDKGILKIENIPKIPAEFEPISITYYGFDSEDNSGGKPHFFQFATRDHAYISSSFRLLIRYIIQTYDLNSRNNVVWGTNIEYDLGNLLKDWDVNVKTCDLKWTKGGLKKYELFYDPEHLDWADKENDKEGVFKVWDTLNHWKMRVSDIGEALTERLGFDFNKLHKDFYSIKYAAMDAILSRSYACMQKSYYDKKGIALRFTPGATSLGHYMNGHNEDGELFCKHKLFETHDDEELKWLIEGLRGGRTEIFSLKEYRGKVAYYDINSAYPFAMKFGSFPHPGKHRWVEGHDKIKKMVENGYEGMIDCDVDTADVKGFVKEIPYLGTIEKKTGRYIFPLGKWKGKYSVFEIKKALALGYKFNFKKAILYEISMYQPFADFVDFCYAIRDEGTKNKDKILRDIGKSLGNNLFGKFGQRLRTSELKDRNDYDEKDIEDCIKIGDGVIIEEDKGFARHTNVIWSVYITAMCRDLLYNHMLNAWAAGNEVIYCDTDSIFIAGGGAPESHQTKLGALKHEGDLTYFKAILPKTYIYEVGGKTHYKAKGVPSEHQETFLAMSEIELRKPMKIREALRRKNCKEKTFKPGMSAVNVWVTIKKQLKGKYTKRKINKDGSTIPITL